MINFIKPRDTPWPLEDKNHLEESELYAQDCTVRLVHENHMCNGSAEGEVVKPGMKSETGRAQPTTSNKEEQEGTVQKNKKDGKHRLSVWEIEHRMSIDEKERERDNI